MKLHSYKTIEVRALLLLLHFALVMVLLSLSRLVYYFYNYSHYAHLSWEEVGRAFGGGLLFDGAAYFYTNALYALLLVMGAWLPTRWEAHWSYCRLRDVAFLFPNIGNLFVNISDTAYYPFVLRRTSLGVFHEFQNDNLFLLYGKFIVLYWPLTLTFLALVVLLVWGYYSVRLSRSTAPLSRSARYVKWGWVGVEMLTIFAIAFFTIRGKVTFRDRPMTVLHANNYVTEPQDRDLVLNTPFTLIRTSKHNRLKEYTWYTPEQLSALYTPKYQAAPLHEGDSLFGRFAGHNVVVIILESFAREYTGGLNRHIDHYPSYTPFLDSLMQESYVYSNAYANGRISVAALPSLFASLPSWDIHFVLSHYAGNELLGLPQILGDRGYSSTFYHGAMRGSMGFDAFVKQIGVQGYYGKEEHNNPADDDGSWGIFDGKFLPGVAAKMRDVKEPFLSILFTLSSHTPYRLPDEYKGVISSGTQPIHAVVRYADGALRDFWSELQKAPWYDNTLFVIVADHASQSDRPEYAHHAGRYAIPILLHDPKGRLQGEQGDIAVQQVDLLPTLLYLMGDATPIVTFGHNAFDPSAPHCAIVSDNDTFLLFHHHFTLSMDKAGIVSTLPRPPYLPAVAPPLGEEALAAEIERYSHYLKAAVQSYTYRMIHNELVMRP